MRRALPYLLPLVMFTLSACDDDKPKEKEKQQEERVRVYSSEDDCKLSETASVCEEAFKKSREEHVRAAPKYKNQSSCEDEYGKDKCFSHRDSSGSDVFLPLMAGALIGYTAGKLNTTPFYTDRNNMAYAGGQNIGSYTSCRPDDYSCRRTSSASSGGGSTGYSGYIARGGSSSSVWSSGSYTVTSPISSGGFGKPSAIAPSATARGGFGGSASAAASSSGS